MPFDNNAGTIVTLDYLEKLFDTEKCVLLCQWFGVYFTLAYCEYIDQELNFEYIVESISLPGQHFSEHNNKRNDSPTYIMDRDVKLSVDNSYLTGYFDHYHVSNKNRYKQTDSYKCGVLVAINMMMRMSFFEQTYLDEHFNYGVLHQVRLLYCYVSMNLYKKYGKHPSTFTKSKQKELSGNI